MKKLFFTSAALLLGMMAMAQESVKSDSTANSSNGKEEVVSNEFKPDQGSIIAEIGFTPFSTNSVTLLGGQLRVVYVLSEQIELKLGLGFGINKDIYDNKLSGSEYRRETNRTSRFSIAPGVNYVFKGTKRLEPFLGAEIGFAMLGTDSIVEENGMKTEVKNAEKGFNEVELLITTGFDFYVSKNLFVGVEVGLGVGAEFHKGTKTETTVGGHTDKTKDDARDVTVDFAPRFTPSIRLGWAF